MNDSIVPDLSTAATPEGSLANVPDGSPPLGCPDAAGSPRVGGTMIQRLTCSLTCAVGSPFGHKFGAEAIRSALLVNLIDLLLAQGQMDQAEELLATSIAGGDLDALTAAHLLSRTAELESRKGDFNEQNTLQILWDSRRLWSDPELVVWAGVRLAKYLSRDGQHAQAIEMLTQAGGPVEGWGPALHAAAGTVLRRQGNPSAATHHLDQALPAFSSLDHDLQCALIALDRAACDLQLMRWDEASENLILALKSELVKQVPEFLRALEELPDLLEHGMLDLYCTEVVTAILPFLQIVDRSGTVRPERITVLGLGRITALMGRQVIPFRTFSAPVLLAALAAAPGLTRRDLRELFGMLSSEEAEQAVRDGICDLREHVSPDVLDIDETQILPTYRLRAGLEVQVDILACLKALQEGNLARAMLLYRGEVLPFFHYSTMINRWRGQIVGSLYTKLQNALDSVVEDEPFVGMHPSASVYEEWVDHLSWGIVGAKIRDIV
ncbi:tetratricopeptide repeat protein (plasmid) [Deinococcus radiomollis]|uniref:tetratricopeptide repeat protein n=1 Tax=Deinococcus radiomollis TaxID=468916 RepID=UPI0038928A99